MVEVLTAAVGFLLRLLLPFSYDVKDGYDYYSHAPYVDWFIKQDKLPPTTLVREVFHPPGFYWLSGHILRFGGTHQTLVWVSALSGCLRLFLIWYGLRLLFPTRPL